jgi:hypothetical protein
MFYFSVTMVEWTPHNFLTKSVHFSFHSFIVIPKLCLCNVTNDAFDFQIVMKINVIELVKKLEH